VNRFGSVGAVGNAVSTIYSQALPEDYYAKFTANINGVTTDDMTRVAKQYIDLGHLNIVIVGDRKVIEGPLKATKIAPIVVLDPEGRSIVP
jgi:predicted Zn-dependent peptidase